MDYEKAVQEYVDPGLYDQFFGKTPFLQWLIDNAEKGNFGTKVEVNLETSGGNAGSYHDLEEINLERKQVLSQAFYPSKQYYGALTISHKEDLAATSPEDKVDLLMAKKNNAMKTLRKELESGATSGTGGDDLVGIDGIVSTDGDSDYSGSSDFVGDIDSASYSWWANQYEDVGGAITTHDIIRFAAECSDDDGSDPPTNLWTGRYLWAYMWGALLDPSVRYTSGELNQPTKLVDFMGYPLAWDGNFDGTGANSKLYFLNKDYLKARIHKDDDFKRWPMQKPVNQFAYHSFWTITLAMICKNRKRQGVMHTITAATS